MRGDQENPDAVRIRKHYRDDRPAVKAAERRYVESFRNYFNGKTKPRHQESLGDVASRVGVMPCVMDGRAYSPR